MPSFPNAPPSVRFRRFFRALVQPDPALRRQQQIRAWSESLVSILQVRHSEADLLQRFCESILHNQVASFAAILCPDPNGTLQTVAIAGSHSVLAGVKYSIHADLPEGKGPLGLVWREARPFYSSPLHNSLSLHAWTDRLNRLGVSSTAVIPLSRLQKVCGVLLLLRPSGDVWTSESYDRKWCTGSYSRLERVAHCC